MTVSVFFVFFAADVFTEDAFMTTVYNYHLLSTKGGIFHVARQSLGAIYHTAG